MDKVETIQGYIDNIDGGLRLELPQVLGYSSAKIRNLLHLLVSNFASHYLEIGVHTGSTFIPAIWESDIPVTCIDNWCRFGNHRPEFEANLALYELLTDRVNIIEQDCWTVNLEDIEAHGGKVDVYFYDGEHHKEDQYQAIDYYAPVLADEFILIVDDANYPDVVTMTRNGLADNKVSIVKEWQLPGPFNAIPVTGELDDWWWNKLLVMVCHK